MNFNGATSFSSAKASQWIVKNLTATYLPTSSISPLHTHTLPPHSTSFHPRRTLSAFSSLKPHLFRLSGSGIMSSDAPHFMCSDSKLDKRSKWCRRHHSRAACGPSSVGFWHGYTGPASADIEAVIVHYGELLSVMDHHDVFFVCYIKRDICIHSKTSLHWHTTGPTISGPFREVVGLGS